MRIQSSRIVYTFVDLKSVAGQPDVFIVPSTVVANAIKAEFKRPMFRLTENRAEAYRERRDRITSLLNHAEPVEDDN